MYGETKLTKFVDLGFWKFGVLGFNQRFAKLDFTNIACPLGPREIVGIIGHSWGPDVLPPCI